MNPSIDKFLTAYQQWPSDEQMRFAMIVVAVSAAIAFCCCWWAVSLSRELLFYVSVWWRGWPEYQEHVGGLLPKTPDRPDEPQNHPLASLRPLGMFVHAVVQRMKPMTPAATVPAEREPLPQPTLSK